MGVFDMAQLVREQYPAAYDGAINDRCFHCINATAGIALLAPADDLPTIVNWADSAVNVAIRSLRLGYKSGNNAPGNVIWAQTPDVGSGIGGAITTLTAVNKVPCLYGSGDTGSAKVQWAPATINFAGTPTYLAPTGISLFTGVAATAVAPYVLEVKYNGEFIIAPGNALTLAFSTTTTTALFNIDIVIEEIPV